LIQPADYPRRSFLYRQLLQAGCEFAELGDAVVAMRYGQVEREAAVARRMGLADLSPLPRTGFKGAGAPVWLSEQGLMIPPEPNLAVTQADQTLVARLSQEEHLILDTLSGAGNRAHEFEQTNAQQTPDRCYVLPRRDSHFWFALTGEHTAAMLAKICGVDMRPHKFADGCIAQTSVARINAVVIRNDLGDTLSFYLLADSASADYLWPCLIDAMDEFEGACIGLAALRDLAQRPK